MMEERGRSDTPDINARLAARVRQLRAQLYLTLDGLAEKSNVSRSMLSLVERGESSPTAVVLEKIAAGLGVPLATLFEDPSAPASPVSRHSERTSWRDPDTGYIRRNLSPPNFPSPLQLVEVTLPAGARVAYESAERDGSTHQHIWVQEGALEVTAEGVTHRLASEDCLAMQLKGPTTFRNRTRKPTRYLVALATERSPFGRR